MIEDVRGGVRAGVAAALLLVAAGCGGADEPTGGRATTDPDAPWRTSSAPVDTTGLVWASGSTVRLADGTTIETGAELQAYVVAGDGVFFIPAEDPEEVGSATTSVREVQFAAPGRDPVGTGVKLTAETLSASPDGRYVGGLDLASGEQDGFGTPIATARVFDLRSGEEVVRSDDGMGDPGKDDVAVLYEDTTLGLRLGDDAAYVDVARGDWTTYPLPSGDPEELPQGEDPPIPDPDSLESPDGAWAITADRDRNLLRAAGGATVTPQVDARTWRLGGWLDDQTVVGYAELGPAALMTCTVPDGACEVLEKTAGQMIVLPRGATAFTGLDLRGGGA